MGDAATVVDRRAPHGRAGLGHEMLTGVPLVTLCKAERVIPGSSTGFQRSSLYPPKADIPGRSLRGPKSAEQTFR
jgi:hypothetical protein